MRRVGAHQQLTDVEPRHDRLARTRVIGEDEAQWLARQQRLVDRRDLVREGIHVRGVDGHHRVEEECEVDALGLDRELERLAVAVEGPGALGGGEGDRGLVGPPEQAIPEGAVRRLVDDLDRTLGDGDHRDDRGDGGWFQPGQRAPGDQLLNAHARHRRCSHITAW
jgi:hypothetical protein